MRRKGFHTDLSLIFTLFVLAVLFFFPVTLGGKTMLPADNVFVWEPWQSYAQEMGVGIPHNGLLSDLYLENYVWKRFIVQSLKSGAIPLWNPYTFSGAPFLAAGQHSAIYPLSLIFYVLPLPAAYGWFAVVHLFLAGLNVYILSRTLKLTRPAAMVAAVTFMFSGFMVIRNVFPMIIAAAVWLPLLLAIVERMMRRLERGEGSLLAHLPDLAVGIAALGMSLLAGHAEMYFYIGLTTAFYAVWRLGGLLRLRRSWAAVSKGAGLLLILAFLGVGLGAAQWLPLLELVRYNFRQGGASFSEVLSWAFPLRRIIALFIPDFFGNPAHHHYYDLFGQAWAPVTHNALGQEINTIYWGIKNYVEGASYVGTLPIILALIGLLRRKQRQAGLFGALAVLSLFFVFGSPLYYLVYKLPGLSQVHSPFRWVLVYSLSMAILAGMGFDALGTKREETKLPLWDRLARFVPGLALLGGTLLLVLLGLSLLAKDHLASLCDGLVQRLALAPQAFLDGQMFYSYQFRNLLIFGCALALGGLLLVARHRFSRQNIWAGLVVLVVAAELFLIGKPFFPAIDPKLVAYETPAIAFLRQDPSLFRITSFVGGDDKTLNANAGMFYDLYDVRGYDSIILKQYADYMGLIQEQGELPYNRIAPISDRHREALDSPLFDLLNVKYVLCAGERQIDNDGYTLVYDSEIRIYRNEGALPRAFLVPEAVVIADEAQRMAALPELDPLRQVILEEPVVLDSSPAIDNLVARTEIVQYTGNEVTIAVDTPHPAYLVLADTYFEGWLAYIRPADAEDPSLDEQSLPIYRANGNFRAVSVPAGQYVVRFKYSPNAIKFGLYISFLAAVMICLGLGLWAWMRWRQPDADEHAVQRVTKNTVTPLTLNLINKIIDMAFAMLMLRILGPADAGKYYLAVVIVSWFDILVNFGLNMLVTREVAKDKSQANRYLANSMSLRAGLWVAAIPVLGLFFLGRQVSQPLDGNTMLAIALFGVGLLPSNLSASISAVFSAYEKMETPASVTTMTTLLKVTLGTVALLLNTGFLGLAVVSIVVNLITLAVLYYLLRKMILRPHAELDLRFQRRMIIDSYPLMINLLLATLFFKMAVLLLEWLLDDTRVIGWYSTAYKYIDAVGLIPAYFTMAVFPLMSRYAATAKDSLFRAYRLAVKLLLIVAIPLALVISALSPQLITILGGAEYLPHAARVLRVMIWYMPFGFINSVTQYVLIALDQQRFLTRAFVIGLSFNVIANLLLINRIGYMGASYVAIFSEIALLIPFAIGIHRHLAPMAWPRLVWKQGLSALPMLLMFLLLPARLAVLSVIPGVVLYLIGLRLLHVFDVQEMAAVGRALPVERIKARMGRWLRRGAA